MDTPVDVTKQFITGFERRQRNLYKRKSKLDAYRAQLSNGEALNEEQRKAVEGYDGVMQSIGVLQEVLAQSKELVTDVEAAVSRQNDATDLLCQNRIVKFLHTQLCLMKLMDALDSPSVQMAISRSSSDNHLKLLQVVRNLITPPALSDWPGSNSSALAEAPSFIESHRLLEGASKLMYDFVVGSNNSIPFRGDHEVSVKKCNTFKDVRCLCFRLLATPAVQRALGVSTPSESTVSSVRERAKPMPNTCIDESDHANPVVPTGCLSLEVHEVANTYTEIPEKATSPAVIGATNSVNKPSIGAFNFLQASKIVTLDQRDDSHSNQQVASTRTSECMSNPQSINDGSSQFIQDVLVSPKEQCASCTYAPVASPQPEVVADHNLPTTPIDNACFPLQYDQPSKLPDPPVDKPMSFADLVRRQCTTGQVSAHGQPHIDVHDQEKYSTHQPTDFARVEHGRSGLSPTQPRSAQGFRGGGGGFYRAGVSRGRGQYEYRGRGGAGNNFGRGNFGGPQRRGVGGSRGVHFEGNRGGRPPFRGVAQPTY